jgi:hypothetical protein
VQADDYLEGEQILDTVYRHGWRAAAHRSYITDLAFASERIGRMMAAGPQPPKPPLFAPDDPTGVHRFGRAQNPGSLPVSDAPRSKNKPMGQPIDAVPNNS